MAPAELSRISYEYSYDQEGTVPTNLSHIAQIYGEWYGSTNNFCGLPSTSRAPLNLWYELEESNPGADAGSSIIWNESINLPTTNPYSWDRTDQRIDSLFILIKWDGPNGFKKWEE